MHRKQFLAAAGAALALTLPGTVLAQSRAADPVLSNSDRKLLTGVIDLHVHAAPDTKPRLGSELDFAKAAKSTGLRAILFKSNDFSCHDRAYLIDQMLDGIDVFGSICMNDVIGLRVNPIAVRKALSTTGNLCRCVWLPTQNALYQVKTLHQKAPAIPVLDEQGRVLPEVVEVMQLCAEHNIILASGHSSPAETLVLARKAREIGLAKFVVTHANSGIWRMTPDQIRQAVDLGAFIELSYITNLWGPGTGLPEYERLSDKAFCEMAAIAPERTFVSTDLGQVGMPHPVLGMLSCIKALSAAGFDRRNIELLTRTNPAKLVGLNS